MSCIEFNPPSINGLSLAMVPKNSRVLDIGCGRALLGRFMQENLGCRVTGVEIDPKLKEIAKKGIGKVIVGDLEDKKIQKIILRQPKFDVIFASAILEHLKHPQIALKQITKSLKKGGIIIISLPNIAHWSIRKALLFGNFNHTPSGILDKSHLKFFTVRTAINFLEKDCSLKIEAIHYDFPDVPIVSRLIKLSLGPKTQEKIFRLFPNLFAYQILVVAKPK